MAAVGIQAGMRETTQPGDECRTYESTGLLTFTIDTGTSRSAPSSSVMCRPAV